MKKYELTLVLRPDLKKEAQEKLLTKIGKWLGKGKIINTKEWGKKTLSYPIKKETEGVYYLLEIELQDLEKGGEIRKKLRLEENVLRHLLISC